MQYQSKNISDILSKNLIVNFLDGFDQRSKLCIFSMYQQTLQCSTFLNPILEGGNIYCHETGWILSPEFDLSNSRVYFNYEDILKNSSPFISLPWLLDHISKHNYPKTPKIQIKLQAKKSEFSKRNYGQKTILLDEFYWDKYSQFQEEHQGLEVFADVQSTGVAKLNKNKNLLISEIMNIAYPVPDDPKDYFEYEKLKALYKNYPDTHALNYTRIYLKDRNLF